MIDLKQVIKDTQDLIRIDSQNPGIQEAACGEWVGNRLSDMGLAVKSEVVEGNRKNYIASVPGEGDGPRLVLLAHIDTVPIGGGWTVDPLGGEIINDRIYGRGACDMKGGVAVSLGLVEALVKQKRGMRGDLVFVATVDEEAPDMAGSQALVKDGFFRADDQVLALEPSGTRLRIAQMGLRWLQVNVKGRMAHAGRAHLGIDSAHVMSRIVDRLKGHIASLPHEDEILGKARFTCGTFNSGVATNVVPPSAEAYFDVRIVPPRATTRSTSVSMSAPIPRNGVPKMGEVDAGECNAAFRADAAASSMLRSLVSAAICGTAAIEKLSVSAA